MYKDVVMTYDSAVKYIEATLRFGSKPGLSRIRNLLESIGNPQDDLRYIHVAGTNGKGSVSKAVSSVLTKSGFKTGLFISPYVTEFCERIQINGKYISHSDLAEEVEYLKCFIEKSDDQLTEFEIITALAFDYFKKQNCDIVVLEVGLGGRFDATNIIKKPLVSVITLISYDHMKILGDTLPKIAYEKCGIIKDGGITVSAPNQKPEVLETIMSSCAERSNTLILPNLSSVKIIKERIDGTDINYGGTNIHIPLPGRHQIANFITAYETLKALSRQGIDIPNDKIAEGMASVRFPARLEILSRSPLVILDGAHNVNGAEALADYINRYLREKPVIIIGMLRDKEYEKAAAILAPLAKSVITVKPDNPRALDHNQLADIVKKYCHDTIACDDHMLAFKKALELSNGSPVIICGSLYLASTMRNIVLQHIDKDLK